jgi:predicted secreted protein
MSAVNTGKKQGYLAQIGVVPQAGGSAVLCATMKDVDWEVKAAKLDATDRSTAGWEGSMYGLSSWTATAKFDYFEGDTQLAEIRTAIFNKQPVSVALYHELNAGSGEPVYTGQAIISSAKFGGKTSDLQGMDVQLDGNGALVLGAQ